MIGERLAELRKDNGLTQEQLAKKLNLTKSNISAYERDYNEPPDDTKIALAKCFHVSMDYLLGLTDQPSAYDMPKNCILLSRDFPPIVKSLLQFFARMVMVAYRANPKATINEMERIVHALASISEEEK